MLNGMRAYSLLGKHARTGMTGPYIRDTMPSDHVPCNMRVLECHTHTEVASLSVP